MKVNEIFNKKRIIAFVMAFAMVVTSLSGISFASNAEELDDKTPIYRLYNANTSDHFFTASENQRDEAVAKYGYTYEKVAYYEPLISDMPVYCMVCPNSAEHIYSANIEELSSWVAVHPEYYLQDDGDPVFYSADATTGTAVYQFFNPNQTADKASHMGALEGSDDYNQLIAWQWQNDGVKFYAYPAEEPVEKEMTAVQTGAKEITVTLSDEAEGTETFTVLKGTTEQSVASTAFDGDTVVLTLDATIKDAEYTVISSDEQYEPASFIGEESELSAIYIGDELIYQGQNAAGKYTYMAAVKTVDQFGSDFTVNTMDSTVTTAPHDAGVNYNKAGYVTIANSTELLVGQEYSISLVSGTVVGTGTVKVSAASVVSELVAGELSMTPSEAKINTTGRIDSADISSGNYFFPIYAKDQYGYPLSAKQLNDMVDNNTLIITPKAGTTGVINADPTATGTEFADVDGTVVMFVGGAGQSYGQGLIQFVSTSGMTSQATAYIDQNERIESLEVMPLDTLQVNAPTLLYVTAENNYGEEVDLYSEVTYSGTPATSVTFTYVGGDSHGKNFADNKTKIALTSVNNSQITVVKDATTKQTGFAITPADKNIIMTITTAGETSIKAVPLTAVDAGVVTEFGGLSDDAVVTLPMAYTDDAADVTKLVSSKGFVLLDQYGNEIDQTTTAAINAPSDNTTMVAGAALNQGTAAYTLEKVSGTSCDVLTNGTGGIIRKADKSGVTKFSAKLYVGNAQSKAALMDEYTFSVTVADDDYQDVMAVAVTPGNLLYTGETNAGSQDLTKDLVMLNVYATDSTGNTVKITEDNDYDITVTGLAGETKLQANTVAGQDLLVVKTADNYVPASGANEGTATIHIWIEGEDVAQAEVNYSNAPKAPQGYAMVSYPTVGGSILTATPVALDSIPVANTATLNVANGAATIVDVAGTVNTTYEVYPYSQYGTKQGDGTTKVVLKGDKDNTDLSGTFNPAARMSNNETYNITLTSGTQSEIFSVVVGEGENSNVNVGSVTWSNDGDKVNTASTTGCTISGIVVKDTKGNDITATATGTVTVTDDAMSNSSAASVEGITGTYANGTLTLSGTAGTAGDKGTAVVQVKFTTDTDTTGITKTFTITWKDTVTDSTVAVS